MKRPIPIGRFERSATLRGQQAKGKEGSRGNDQLRPLAVDKLTSGAAFILLIMPRTQLC